MGGFCLIECMFLAVERLLKNERTEHKQVKNDLERKTRQELDVKEKTVAETLSKFSSIQQHYKLLQTQHDDFTDECAKSKAKQLDEINGLQDKLKSQKSENDQVVRGKNQEIEQLKVNWTVWKRVFSGFTRIISVSGQNPAY